MKKRLLKAVSVPIALFVLMIPMIIYQSIVWVIYGERSPMDVVDSYMNWLIND